MEKKLFNLLNRKTSHFEKGAREDISRAFLFASEKHKDQKRYSGEPFIIHPLSVAIMLAEKDFDPTTVLASLLHDTIEDTEVTAHDIIKLFGYEVANIVQGVTKIFSLPIKDKVLFFSEDEVFAKRIDNYRKLLIATGKDIRVMVIKLYDRLHNVQTLKFVPREKQKFYAKESIEIYAKIAERIGLNDVKVKIEDESFPFAYPDQYKELGFSLKDVPNYDPKMVLSKITEIKGALSENGVDFLEVNGRLKHKLSIYNKLRNQHESDISRLFDLNAFRIIVSEIEDCYRALGVIHSSFTPVPGRIYDFISTPKENGYRSLHTTLSDKDGKFFEVQIRTPEMHYICEFGMAAHWHYKDSLSGKYSHQLKQNLVEWNQEIEKIRELDESGDALNYIRAELFSEKIFVATPKGEIIKLPKGSTPIDFAFKIHTNLGLTCSGARVNSKIVTLDTKLRNGDIVEIITSGRAKPSRDWLKLIKTDGARQKINQYLRGQNRERFVAIGREIMRGYLKKYSLILPDEAQFNILLSNSKVPYNDLDSALAAVGQKYFTPTKLAKAIIPNFAPGKSNKKSQASKKIGTGKILSGISYSYAKCCKPKSGDDLIGYVTKNHVLKIHKKECKWLEHTDKSRIIEV
jgi:guanosine-3',5'-bis(diphosphate) 3'-pyrophosphohydrolase